MPPIDYKSFNAGQDKSGKTFNNVTKRWWLLPKNSTELADSIVFLVNMLAQYDQKRQTQNQISARLYGNVTLMGVNGLSFSKISSTNNAMRDRISYNLSQSITDTVVAKLQKNKPKPLFLTSGGMWNMQQRAKKLTKFVDGIFYENKAYEDGPLRLRDACIFGDGLTYVFNDRGRVKFERVIPSEIFVDQVEAFYGEPRQIHRCKNIDREVLMDLFPAKKKDIESANAASADLTGTFQNIADQISVVESWHLPSGPGATDGRHCICIEGKTLLDEPYTKERFPFARLPWCKRIYGFWGQGLVEQTQNIQLEINKLLWVIQRAMHMAGTFKILVENGSKIVKEHFTNDFGAMLCYTGTPPQYIVPPVVPPEMYAHLQTLIRQGYEQAGISQLSAASQKPAGLNSGKALREAVDIESDRFTTIEQAYENYYLDLADLAIDTARDIHEEDGKFSVKTPGKRFLEEIDWGSIDLKRDEYIMQKYPVSSLPDTPEGRLSTIQEYMQAGLLSPRAGRKLLDFPDLEAEEKLANAAEDYLEMVVDKIVSKGEYTKPEIAYDDVSIAREMALEQYEYGKAHGLEEDRLQMLRDFMDDITRQQSQVQAAQQQQAMQQMPQAGAPAAPMAAPQPTPTSNLVPNVA